jgi:hypothetical protein
MGGIASKGATITFSAGTALIFPTTTPYLLLHYPLLDHQLELFPSIHLKGKVANIWQRQPFSIISPVDALESVES